MGGVSKEDMEKLIVKKSIKMNRLRTLEGGTQGKLDGGTKTKPKNKTGEISDDFEESMLEDMRGPMEGMEAIPSNK